MERIVLQGDLLDFGQRQPVYRNMTRAEIVRELMRAHGLLAMLPPAPPAPAPRWHEERAIRNYDPPLPPPAQ